LKFSSDQVNSEEVVTLRDKARLKFGIEGSMAEHLVISGIESNSAYVAEQDEIKILYKDGTVKPLSTTVDFGVESRRIEKSFLAYPRELN